MGLESRFCESLSVTFGHMRFISLISSIGPMSPIGLISGQAENLRRFHCAISIVHCSSFIVHLSLWNGAVPAMTNER